MVCSVTITYQENGQEKKEFFKSILDCSFHYKIPYTSLILLGNMGINKKDHRLPIGCQVEISECLRVVNQLKEKWRCPLCDSEIARGSIKQHIKSAKHIRLSKEEEDSSNA